MVDIDGEGTRDLGGDPCEVPLDIFGAVKRIYIPIEMLQLGKVPETDNSWKSEFHKDSVYPPIVVEFDDSGIHILHGNHRVIMWREWRFKYAPSWIAFSKYGEITLPQGLVVVVAEEGEAQTPLAVQLSGLELVRSVGRTGAEKRKHGSDHKGNHHR